MNQPHIAILQPHESITSSFSSLLAKNTAFTYEMFPGIQEIIDLHNSGQATFDIIIVPSQLHDKSSAVTVCIQLKSDPVFSLIPIIVLSNIKDLAVISTFYGSGADIVLNLPLETKLLNLQVTALDRLQKTFSETQKSSERDIGLRQAMISALHFVEEALVIFDPKGNVVFSNQAAKQLLNLYDDLQSTNIQKAYNLLQDFCLRAAGEIQNGKPVIYHKNITLVKNTGENLVADMRITSLRSLNNEIIAYCLSIVDIAAPSEISGILAQSERAQFIALLLASANLQLLNTNSFGTPTHPLSKLEQVFARENPISSISSTCTSLLEFIDNIAASSQIFRFNVTNDIKIAVKPSHLFILIGNMIFYCMRNSNSKSETTLSLTPTSNSFYVCMRISTKNINEIDKSKEVVASSAIRNEFLNLTKNTNFATSLDQAKKIASIYKLQVSVINSKENLTELEIELPISM